MSYKYRNKISFTCTCLRSKEDILSYKALFKEGFGGVEIFYPYNVSDEQREIYTSSVEELLRDEKLTRIMHLPHGAGCDLGDYEHMDFVMKTLEDAILYGKKFGCDRFTLHLGKRREDAKELYGKDAVEVVIDKLKELCDYAYPAKIMVENMPSLNEVGCTLEELKYIFESVERCNIKLIYDTGHGHVMLKDTEKEIELLTGLKDYLYHFHINDNDSSRDQHQRIGNGNVEFEKIFGSLENYKQMFSLEILFNSSDDLRNYKDSLVGIFKNL